MLYGATGGWQTAACCSLLLLLLERSCGSTHVGFPVPAQGGRGASPTTDAGIGARRDAGSASERDVWVLGLPSLVIMRVEG